MLDILIPLNLLCRPLNEPSLNFTLLFLLKAENYTTEKELNFEKDVRHFSNDIAHFPVFIELGSVLKVRLGFFGICQP